MLVFKCYNKIQIEKRGVIVAGENLVRPKGLKAKIENFWYHYKTHTIIFITVFVTLAVSIAQCSSKPDYDYTIIAATRSMTLSTPQLEAITEELEQYGEDLNGDGSVEILLIDCTIDGQNSDFQSLQAKQERLMTQLMHNVDAMLFLTDTKALNWIDTLNDKTQFIADTGLPHNDGRGFLISDTHIIEKPKAKADYEQNLRWPKDLYICRRKVEGTAFEGKDSVEENKKAADLFIQQIIKENTK